CSSTALLLHSRAPSKAADPKGLPLSSDFAQLGGVRQGAQLLQALVLDQADALAGHVERAADLVQRARMLSVEAIAQLKDRALPRGQRAQDLLQSLLAERDLGLLVGKRK